MNKRQIPFAIGLAVLIAGAVQAHAAVSMPGSMHRVSDASASCEAARQSAWFERQRQLSDGDVDPRQPIATPAECMRVSGGANAREQQAEADAAHRLADVHSSQGPRDPGGA